MKTARFVYLSSVSTFAVLLIVMTAQSNPVVDAGHADTSPSAQVLTAASAQSAAVSPAVRFAAAVPYNLGVQPTFVAIGDLNGDGRSDLVVASFCDPGCETGSVEVLLGNGDGTFQPPVSYGSGGCGYASVVIGDVNGDGKPDLVVGSTFQNNQCDVSGDGAVGVLLGNGDGTFQPPVSYDSGGYNTQGRITGSVAMADLNGDGHPDLVVANSDSNSVGVLLNNGDGTFQAAVSYSSGEYSADSVSIADLNGDGHPDLVVAGGGVSVLLGNGDGTFQPAVGYSSSSAVAVAIGDLNGDGHPDILLGKYAVPSVDVLFGNGDGTFQPAVSYSTGGAGSWAVAIADVNGDGYLDLAVANGAGFGRSLTGEVSVLLGNGDGTFHAPQHYKTGGDMSYSVAVGDVNGDGRPDLVVPNVDTATVGVLLNLTIAGTKTAVTSSLNPSPVNQQVAFTATITSAKLPIPDGETVTFYSGNLILGTALTKSGSASVATSFSKAKNYTIKAEYPGDGFRKASSGTLKQVVNP